MKKISTFFLMLLLAAIAHAQIPNASFENWSGGLPVGWWGQNNPDTLFVQSTYAYTGSYALRMNVAAGGIPYGGYIYSGDSANWNFPIPAAPGALYGWYIANIGDSGDILTVSAQISSQGFALGNNNGIGLSEATPVYKQFAFTFTYIGQDQGTDSAYIEFGIQNQTANFLSSSTYFIIDDLSFGPAAGIAEISDQPVLEQCVPNPASSIAKIVYSIGRSSTVSLDLYDLSGKKLMTLLSETQQTPGRYRIPTDVSGLANGDYIYSLHVNGQTYSQKLVVAR